MRRANTSSQIAVPVPTDQRDQWVFVYRMLAWLMRWDIAIGSQTGVSKMNNGFFLLLRHLNKLYRPAK